MISLLDKNVYSSLPKSIAICIKKYSTIRKTRELFNRQNKRLFYLKLYILYLGFNISISITYL